MQIISKKTGFEETIRMNYQSLFSGENKKER